MNLKDFHVHSTFSDGNSTPEEIVLEAIKKGLTEIGISDHSYTPFDTEPCKNMKDIDKYISEINGLKQKYADKIKVYCGTEQDYYSGKPDSRFDYVIASVHYLKLEDNYVCIDYGVDKLLNTANKYFGGDFYALVEKYYETISNIVEQTGANIIGHFDVIAKYNEKHHLFDENSERYRNSWKKAVDKLLKTGAVFEINTGAVSRGHRCQPYPSQEIRNYISEHGGKFLLSSDSHQSSNICAKFEDYEQYNSCKSLADML